VPVYELPVETDMVPHLYNRSVVLNVAYADGYYRVIFRCSESKYEKIVEMMVDRAHGRWSGEKWENIDERSWRNSTTVSDFYKQMEKEEI
jgi:hypothetical protein